MSSASLRTGRLLLTLIDPLRHTSAFFEAVRLFVVRFPLTYRLSLRDLRSRYKGQMIGVLWNIIHPLFLMMVFVFIFGVVFNQRMAISADFPGDYTMYILSGLVPWLSIVPLLASSSLSITGNAQLIKQFDFEAEILPFKEVLISLVFYFIGLGVVIFYSIFQSVKTEDIEVLKWTYLLLPALFVLHLCIISGIALLLCSLNVFIRDIKDLVAVFATVGLYVLPVIYLPAWVPNIFTPVLYANPFSYLIWCYQDVLFFGRIEHPTAWVVTVLFAILSLSAGYRVFRRLRPMFGNAL